MRLTEISYGTAQPVEGYGPGFFRVGGHVLRGACLIRAGQRSEGAALIARSRAAVTQRWPAGTYIGAAERGHEALVR